VTGPAAVDQLLQQFGEQNVVGFFLVLARVSPLFVLAPLFSSRLIPGRVRGIAAVALAVGLSPVLVKGHHLPTAPADLTWLIGKELLIGLAFAFVIGALFTAVTVAGSFLDTMIGFSYGSLVDPLTGTQSTVLAQAYSLVGMLIFIAIGGDGWVVQGLARTYDMVGLDQAPALGHLVGGVDAVFGSIFISAIEVAGPVLLALILTDAAFGVVSRVVPQLNVFAVGFPAKIVVGLLLVTATLPFVAGWISGELQQDVGAALQAIRVA
jgi:flagellar biosynthesis protein FliR